MKKNAHPKNLEASALHSLNVIPDAHQTPEQTAEVIHA